MGLGSYFTSNTYYTSKWVLKVKKDQDTVAEAGDRISPRRNRDDDDNPASLGVLCKVYK